MKKNLIIILLAILSVGAIGYIVYDKVLSTDEDVINNEKEQNGSDEDKIYSEYLKTLKNNLQTMFEEKDGELSIEGTLVIGEKYRAVINKNGTLSITKNNKNYEIDNNVLTMFSTNVGNGGYKNLYYLKEDGTLNYVCIDTISTDNINVKNTGYKNIVNVINGNFGITTSGASAPVFVDIKGNVFMEGYKSADNNDTENNKNDLEKDLKLFAGSYEYDGKEPGSSYGRLKLYEDGTYTYSYGMHNGGGYGAKGLYAISNDKIYLFNDDCNIRVLDNECVYPNCQKIIELDYTKEGNNIIVKDEGMPLEKIK